MSDKESWSRHKETIIGLTGSNNRRDSIDAKERAIEIYWWLWKNKYISFLLDG